jgi:hypothetical protein
MPCDSIITLSVDLSKCGDVSLLLTALESIGAKYVGVTEDIITFNHESNSYSIINGKLTGRGYYITDTQIGILSDRIKQSYAKASVYASAKRMGWTVREIAPNKLQVIRR